MLDPRDQHPDASTYPGVDPEAPQSKTTMNNTNENGNLNTNGENADTASFDLSDAASASELEVNAHTEEKPDDANARTQTNAISGDGASRESSSPVLGDGLPRPQQLHKHLRSVGCEFFHDADDVPYASVPYGSREGRVTFAVESDEFTSWLQKKWFEQFDAPHSKSEIEKVGARIKADAKYHGPEKDVHVGIAKQGDAIYFDLRRKDGKVVHIDCDGWTVDDSVPVHFLRKDGMRALPLPQSLPNRERARKALKDLQSFINVSDEDLPLVLAFLLSLFQPGGEVPVLFLQGSAGTGKSTAARFLKSILDPHRVDCQPMPSSEENLAVAAQHSSILAFDNISGTLRRSKSDALCRLSSGYSGVQKRELYSDDGVASISAQAGVILTSIDNVISRGDLIDRTFKVTLRKMKRKSRSKLRELFDQAHPQLLAGLFNAVSVGLQRLEEVRQDESWERPRLIDAAEWIVACEPALPVEPESCLRALHARQEEMKIDILEGNPVFTGIRLYAEEMDEGTTETFTATSLRDALASCVSASKLPKPRGLSEDLNRRKEVYAKELNIEIEKDPKDRDQESRARLIHLRKPTHEEEDA